MITRQTIRCDQRKPSKIARPRVRKPVAPRASTRTFLRIEGLEDRMVPSTFTVTNTADSGLGSLRQAILSSNGTAGPNTINFDIGSNSQTIALLSPLPPVSVPATIDATPPAGFPTQAILLNGSAAGAGADGLDITAGGSTIMGDGDLAIDSFSGTGILLETAGGDMVEHTFIGTDMSSASGLGNSIGIMIMATANNTVGGANIVSANMAQGIVVTGPGATGNLIENNIVGTDRTGTIALPNGGDGVLIEDGASANSVLGVGGHANLISANGGDGVHMTGTSTDDNVVLGNVIGTDVHGSISLANAGAGVAIDSGARSNTIGATSGSAINLISGNMGDGVVIGVGATDTVTTGNLVDDNAIGTDVSGLAALANMGDGILIQGAGSNTIGGTAGAFNLISGNLGWGVAINASNNDQADRNVIGTDVSGSTALGNGMGGVEIIGESANDTLGGSTGVAVINLISGNTGMAQVLIDGTTNVVLASNAIGTDVSGEAPFATSAGPGILVQDGATGTQIGIAGFTHPNLISGNGGNGITITGSSTANATIESAAIGIDVSIMAALPNKGAGVEVEMGATGTAIGLYGAFNSGNFISGNTGDGVLITGSNGATVQGNVIGQNIQGSESSSSAVPNGGSGVEIMGNNNVVGNLSGSYINRIYFNTGFGVLVDSGTGNSIYGNQIFSNGMGGISLMNGANDGVMAPVLSSVTVNASGTTTITGTVTGAPSTAYLIEFYVNESTPAQGEYPPPFTVTETTNASGTVNFTAMTSTDFSIFPSTFVTATATDPNGNTSGFSNGVAVTS